MKILSVFFSGALLMMVSPRLSAAETGPVPKNERLVLAFYYTWYGTPQVSGAWRHWNEGGHKPDVRNAEGLPDIGATHQPVNLYDSMDPDAIARHLKEAGSAGIDALVSSWWGREDYHDLALARCLEIAGKQRSLVKFSAYYETVKPKTVEQAVADLSYLVEAYGSHNSFLHYQGKPVLFIYGRALNELGFEKWSEVLKQFRGRHQALLIADSSDEIWANLFDGLHNYNIAPFLNSGVEAARVQRQLVHSARHLGKIACVNVLPGYDDSHIGRETPLVVERKDGETYRHLWEAAINAAPDWVVITSFNEWHEGSEIEPSREYGSRYLEWTAEYARKFREADFTVPSKPESFTTASIVLGAVNEVTRLVQVEWEDGQSDAIHVKNRDCRVPKKNSATRLHYLYFDVEDGLDLSRGVRVFVEYLDQAKGSFEIQYDSNQTQLPLQGAYKSSTKCELMGDGYWKEYLFVLPNARFTGRQNGMADFRIALLAGEAAFSEIRVESIPPPKPPEPTPKGVPPPPGYGRY